MGNERKMEKIDDIVNQGYQTVKLKTGSNFSEFLSFVESVRGHYPNLNLRIDANQSWTFKQASENLAKLSPYRIEYCEEPLVQPNIESIRKLTKNSHIPIALDESIFQPFSLSEARELAPVLIVKPMIWGSRFMEENILNKNRKHHPKLVFTSSLEGGVGRLMTASLASWLGDSDFAHGLDTGSMLVNDLWTDEKYIKNGHFNLPDAAHFKKLMNSKLPGAIFQEVSI